MSNPWSAWLKFWEEMNREGQEKFERLVGEEARGTATVYHCLTVAALSAACLTAVYFVLLTVALLLSEDRGNLVTWIGVLKIAFVQGWVFGGLLGSILGYSQAQLWQGNRNKAGSNSAIDGAIIIAVIVCVHIWHYDPGIPAEVYLLEMFLFYGPALLFAGALVAWGIKLLKE